MIDITIQYCHRCSKKIINENLKDFWRALCISSITRQKWMPFSNEDPQAIFWLYLLEKKSLIVTHESDNHTFARPLEVYLDEDEDIIICSEMSSHLVTHKVKIYYDA